MACIACAGVAALCRAASHRRVFTKNEAEHSFRFPRTPREGWLRAGLFSLNHTLFPRGDYPALLKTTRAAIIIFFYEEVHSRQLIGQRTLVVIGEHVFSGRVLLVYNSYVNKVGA